MQMIMHYIYIYIYALCTLPSQRYIFTACKTSTFNCINCPDSALKILTTLFVFDILICQLQVNILLMVLGESSQPSLYLTSPTLSTKVNYTFSYLFIYVGKNINCFSYISYSKFILT